MNGTVTIEGVVTPEGTLELAQRLSLPAGRVQVTVVPLPDLPGDDPFWQRMQAMWNAQKSRGHHARSVDEVEAERRAVREEWDESMRSIEQTRAEAERTRHSPGPSS
ncbi:MAG TPA: hypothetical protein VGX76_18450 [Pirellulales bacterium]|jgi:YD repeat-containing protein|nr:hypothetical protein [Pirellulales bacterium]